MLQASLSLFPNSNKNSKNNKGNNKNKTKKKKTKKKKNNKNKRPNEVDRVGTREGRLSTSGYQLLGEAVLEVLKRVCSIVL